MGMDNQLRLNACMLATAPTLTVLPQTSPQCVTLSRIDYSYDLGHK